VRADFEQELDADFGNVRIHTDGLAQRSARAVGARAYTVANHVVFAKDAYDPHTTAGRRLMAHELTHVVQQGSGRHDSSVRGPLKIDTSGEAAAEQAAIGVGTGRRSNIDRRHSGQTGLLQRDATTTIGEVQIFGKPSGYRSRVGKPFPSMDQAARVALEEIAEVSVDDNVELAGNIYQLADGSFSFSTPVRGTNIDSDPGKSPVPQGTRIVATFHSHAGQFLPTDELFSPGDKWKATLGKKVAYLVTPTGHLFKFVPFDLLSASQKTQFPGGMLTPLQP
jgi:hypothetical protein